MTDEHGCSNCIYNKQIKDSGGNEAYICANPESDLYGDETFWDDWCDLYEERE